MIWLQAPGTTREVEDMHEIRRRDGKGGYCFPVGVFPWTQVFTFWMIGFNDGLFNFNEWELRLYR